MQINFRKNLVEIREEIGLSQKDLAEISKLKKTQIVKLEDGEIDPTFKEIEKLATALKVSQEELLFGGRDGHYDRNGYYHYNYNRINNGWEFLATRWWILFAIGGFIVWMVRELRH